MIRYRMPNRREFYGNAFCLTILLSLLLALCSCGGTKDDYDYNALSFPDYKKDNPVRYLDNSSLGQANGWQDFGRTGEIRTIDMPMGSTYTYQMYAYYIRNDLSLLYDDVKLPSRLEELPAWLTKTNEPGHRILWYSMGQELPEQIVLKGTSTIAAGDSTQFLKAEYSLTTGGQEQLWIVYLLQEDDVYSSYAVRVNEFYEDVSAMADVIVQSYQERD